MKSNPSKQELIDFVNQVISEQTYQIKKIQDLSTGIHYLIVLNNIFPNIVKTSKINFKAFHQYESINNLKLLAIYLSQIVAPFTFQITKISQKNYQDNLNLLKNMYKFYFENKSKNQNQKNIQIQKKVTRSTSIIIGNQKNIISKPKIIYKPPPTLQKHQMKKIGPKNQGLKSVVRNQNNENQQIRKILKIVQEEKTQEQQAAQIKLNKIKKILGLSVPQSHKKSKKKQQQNSVNFSIKCTGSKSQNQKNYEFEVLSENKKQESNQTKSQQKKIAVNKNPQTVNQTDFKNLPKKFNCQQIKQTMVKNYQLRLTPSRRNAQIKKSRQTIDNWLKQQDTRQYQNLLSPIVDNEAYKDNNSKRKSILRNSQSLGLQLSKEKVNQSGNKLNTNRKTVHFSPIKAITERKSELSSGKRINQSKKQNIQISATRKSPRS